MNSNVTFKKYIIDAVVFVKNEIDKDPFTKKRLPDFIVDVGIGINRFNKAFKHTTGCTFNNYRLIKRMEIAKEMLEEGTTRKVIARKLGYKNPGNFSTAFKNKVGCAPTEFQY